MLRSPRPSTPEIGAFGFIGGSHDGRGIGDPHIVPRLQIGITTAAGPDVEPYQQRQVAVIRREDRMNWLDHLEPEASLAPLPKCSFCLEQVEGPRVRQVAFGW